MLCDGMFCCAMPYHGMRCDKKECHTRPYHAMHVIWYADPARWQNSDQRHSSRGWKPVSYSIRHLIKLYNTNEILYSDYIVNFLFLPIIDSIRVIIKRTMKKKSIFLPDNFHIHHRLLKKFGFKITIICIFFILIFPHLLVYAGLSGIIIFVLQVMVYSSAIIFSRNVSR